MKLTAFTDYSLRVLIYLAAHVSRRVTIAEIGKAFDINVSHLTKVVHHLGKCGWISTVRGKGGGITLALEPRQICVGQVVRDTEGNAQPAECFQADGGDCAISACCRLRGLLGEAVQAFYAVLDRATLADLTRNPESIIRVLSMREPATRECGA